MSLEAVRKRTGTGFPCSQIVAPHRGGDNSSERRHESENNEKLERHDHESGFLGGERTPSRIVRVEWVKRTRELLAQRMSIGKGRKKGKIR
jgi:hypothetical protein